jgi:hypothetical protein
LQRGYSQDSSGSRPEESSIDPYHRHVFVVDVAGAEEISICAAWLETNNDSASGIVNNLGQQEDHAILTTLWRLASSHRRVDINICMAWLADARVHAVPMEQGRYFVEDADTFLKSKDTPFPSRPVATMVAEVTAWVEWLARQNV